MDAHVATECTYSSIPSREPQVGSHHEMPVVLIGAGTYGISSWISGRGDRRRWLICGYAVERRVCIQDVALKGILVSLRGTCLCARRIRNCHRDYANHKSHEHRRSYSLDKRFHDTPCFPG